MTPDPDAPPKALPAPRIELCENALVLPMAARDDLACGVIAADGSLVPASRTLISANRLTGIPTRPDEAAAPSRHVPGRYLFAGLGRHHFGHFLLECIPRLWALAEPDVRVDGILVVPMADMDFDATLRRRLGPFLNLLTGNLPVHLVTEPVRVEQVLVPTQGIGHRKWIAGSPQFRDFIRRRIWDGLTPEGPEKLYISRSKLKEAEQQVDQEARIERMVRKSGYTIFHPERHSIIDQCRHYMAARQMIGPDGSAFHLAPYAAPEGQRMAMYQRRWRRPAFDALVDQIKAIPQIDLVKFNPLVPRDKLPNPSRPPVPPPIELRDLRRKLVKSGFF